MFDANEATFQTAWFVVSLLTELAVVLVLRTKRLAWRSTPGRALLWITLATAAIALVVPYLGRWSALFGFVALPAHLLSATILVVLGYILATEAAKWRFYRGNR